MFPSKATQPNCEVPTSDRFALASKMLSSYSFQFFLLASWFVPKAEVFCLLNSYSQVVGLMSHLISLHVAV